VWRPRAYDGIAAAVEVEVEFLFTREALQFGLSGFENEGAEEGGLAGFEPVGFDFVIHVEGLAHMPWRVALRADVRG